MAEVVEQPKKKVYVETTVVSDATALPTNDLTLAGRQMATVGRQMATREWCKMRHDATLEEMWRIKEELSTAHDTWEEYIAGILAFQEEGRRRVVDEGRRPRIVHRRTCGDRR